VLNNHILFVHAKKASSEQCKTEIGTATYESGMETYDGTWLATVKSERFIVAKTLAGTETTVELTTETISTDGTESGTALYGATMVFEPTQANDEAGTPTAHEAGKATGDDHVYGIVIVDGTTTTDDLGNETTVDVTMVTTTSVGTDDGTDDH